MQTLAAESDIPEGESCQEIALGISENLEACEAALDSQRRISEVELKLNVAAAKSSAAIKLRGAEQRIKVLESALEATEEKAVRELWERPTFWAAGGFIAGVVVTAAAIYGSIWAIGQLRPTIPAASE